MDDATFSWFLWQHSLVSDEHTRASSSEQKERLAAFLDALCIEPYSKQKISKIAKLDQVGCYFIATYLLLFHKQEQQIPALLEQIADIEDSNEAIAAIKEVISAFKWSNCAELSLETEGMLPTFIWFKALESYVNNSYKSNELSLALKSEDPIAQWLTLKTIRANELRDMAPELFELYSDELPSFLKFEILKTAFYLQLDDFFENLVIFSRQASDERYQAVELLIAWGQNDSLKPYIDELIKQDTKSFEAIYHIALYGSSHYIPYLISLLDTDYAVYASAAITMISGVDGEQLALEDASKEATERSLPENLDDRLLFATSPEILDKDKTLKWWENTTSTFETNKYYCMGLDTQATSNLNTILLSGNQLERRLAKLIQYQNINSTE